MKIVVIGGTGLIGTQLINQLQHTGHQVIAASLNTGVNILTGEGLHEVLQGTDVVVDVSNSPSFEDNDVMNFFKTANENLLPAEKEAGVQHHIALSVVGTQKLQASGYFRAKQKQEELIRASGIPFTIVHATQFFEFAGGIVHMSMSDGKVIVPAANIQPIASKDVAAFVAEKALEKPVNTILEIGGPEKFDMTAWITKYLQTTHQNYEVVADIDSLYSGAPIDADTLVPENAVFFGENHYTDWIAKPENQK